MLGVVFDCPNYVLASKLRTGQSSVGDIRSRNHSIECMTDEYCFPLIPTLNPHISGILIVAMLCGAWDSGRTHLH